MEKMLERHIESVLRSNLGKGKVILLTGARRVGKTQLLKHIAAGKKNPLVLNAEDLDVAELLNEPRASQYKALMQDKDLVVIDEAQTLPDIGKKLKLMIDEMPKLPIVASGSSSFNLLKQSGEPLTGRSIIIELFPISWLELSKKFNPLELQQQMEERLIYGAYPELFQLKTLKEKRAYLKDLVVGYLLKDILAADLLRNTAKLYDLLKLIAFQVGAEVSYDELARALSMSKNTVERYLYILKEGYVLFPLGGFSKNLRKEVTKSSKWYFWDNGIRNAIVNQFEPITVRRDVGLLWENFCISERLKKSAYSADECSFYFWRTYDNQEIDLIIESDRGLEAVEIKWKAMNFKMPTAFEKAYPTARFSTVNKANFAEWIQE